MIHLKRAYYHLGVLLSNSTHPGHDVIMKTVDKVHEFYSQQTHSVNLLFDGLFASNFSSWTFLHFSSGIC